MERPSTGTALGCTVRSSGALQTTERMGSIGGEGGNDARANFCGIIPKYQDFQKTTRGATRVAPG